MISVNSLNSLSRHIKNEVNQKWLKKDVLGLEQLMN